jgi:hypothetical protein
LGWDEKKLQRLVSHKQRLKAMTGPGSCWSPASCGASGKYHDFIQRSSEKSCPSQASRKRRSDTCLQRIAALDRTRHLRDERK